MKSISALKNCFLALTLMVAGAAVGCGESGGEATKVDSSAGTVGAKQMDAAPANICSAAAGDDSCVSCGKNSCCTEVKDCNADEKCLAIYNCTLKCSSVSDTACIAKCQEANPAGVAKFTTLAVCLVGKCATACAAKAGDAGLPDLGRPDTAPVPVDMASPDAPGVDAMARPDLAVTPDTSPDRAPDMTRVSPDMPTPVFMTPDASPDMPVAMIDMPVMTPVDQATPDVSADTTGEVGLDMVAVEPDMSLDMPVAVDMMTPVATDAKVCATDLDCDDKNACTIDKCTAGRCETTGFAPAVTVCRQAIADCDIPEFCDGKTAKCPDDVYRSGNVCRTCSQFIPVGGQPGNPESTFARDTSGVAYCPGNSPYCPACSVAN